MKSEHTDNILEFHLGELLVKKKKVQPINFSWNSSESNSKYAISS